MTNIQSFIMKLISDVRFISINFCPKFHLIHIMFYFHSHNKFINSYSTQYTKLRNIKKDIYYYYLKKNYEICIRYKFI